MSDYTDPTTYDVIPRTWKVVDLPKVGSVVAALMPYPGQLAEDRACSGDDMFTDDAALAVKTKRARMANICASCTVQTACREWAIAHEEYGFWGGTMADDRRYIRRRRKQVLVDPHAAYVYGLREDPYVYVLDLNGEGDAES